MQWMYKNIPFDPVNIPVNYGFVYKITYEDEDGHQFFYLGKKAMWETRKLKPLKNMRTNARRVVTRENKWRDYEGSCKHKLIESGRLRMVEKEILEFAVSKANLTYLELKYLVTDDLWLVEHCLNGNVLGKFYDNVYEPKGEWVKELTKDLNV